MNVFHKLEHLDGVRGNSSETDVFQVAQSENLTKPDESDGTFASKRTTEISEFDFSRDKIDVGALLGDSALGVRAHLLPQGGPDGQPLVSLFWQENDGADLVQHDLVIDGLTAEAWEKAGGSGDVLSNSLFFNSEAPTKHTDAFGSVANTGTNGTKDIFHIEPDQGTGLLDTIFIRDFEFGVDKIGVGDLIEQDYSIYEPDHYGVRIFSFRTDTTADSNGQIQLALERRDHEADQFVYHYLEIEGLTDEILDSHGGAVHFTYNSLFTDELAPPVEELPDFFDDFLV